MWCVGGKLQPGSAGVAADLGGDREHAVAQSFGFPPASGMISEGQQLGPGDQLASEHHDGTPDAVLIESVQRKIGQATVFRRADPVLAACASPVTQFQIGELATNGVGGERGHPPVSYTHLTLPTNREV